MVLHLYVKENYALQNDDKYSEQDPFINIPEETVREVLKIILGNNTLKFHYYASIAHVFIIY